MRIAIANAVNESIGNGVFGECFAPRIVGSHEMQPGMIALANDSIITQSAVNTELTAYAIGWNATNKLREIRDFIAPTRPRATRKVTVKSYVNAEAFQTVDYVKRRRAIGGDFMEIPNLTSTKSTKTLENVGLQYCIDQDQLKEDSNMERMATQWLIDIMLRADVAEAVALLDTGATNASKTWGSTANPDVDVKTENINSANLVGYKANQALVGDAAMLLRMSSYEQYARANSAAAAAAFGDSLASRWGVERYLESDQRYSSSSTARSEFVASHLYLFTARPSEQMIDDSNIVRIVSNASYGGGEYAVYVYDPTPKKRIVMVEAYLSFHAQHTLGMRDLVIS